MIKGAFEVKDIESWGENRTEEEERMNVPQKGAGIVIRWNRTGMGREWGEISFFTQNGRWHLDAEDLSEESVQEILKALTRYAVRKGQPVSGTG